MQNKMTPETNDDKKHCNELITSALSKCRFLQLLSRDIASELHRRRTRQRTQQKHR